MDLYTDALIREIENFSGERRSYIGNGNSGNTIENSLPGESTSAGSDNRKNDTESIDCLPEADTVYFGGGTPNLLGIDRIKKIISAINDNFTINSVKLRKNSCDNLANALVGANESKRMEKLTEITMEINPGSVDGGFLKELHETGINRLSIGAQSFDGEVLRSLGRAHKPEDIIRVFDEARNAGFDNISIDLMFGIPGQSMEVWKASLEETVKLRPEHISLYSLEFMEGTRFTRLLEEGRIAETEPETDREMYEYAVSRLEEAGTKQYEISNFAIHGYESRHNLKYWDLREYAGFGPGAHSYIIEQHAEHDTNACRNTAEGRGRRYCHEPDIAGYIANPVACVLCEPNELKDDIAEFVITALRLNRGIDLNEFSKRFGVDLWDHYGPETHKSFTSYAETGYVIESETQISLTLKGFNISNRILSLFV